MRHEIDYGSGKIEFELRYRAADSISFTVKPSGEVEVIAPKKKPLEAIQDRVLKRAKWIRKQQREFETYENRADDRRYVSGESCRYLGRQYRLRVVEQEPLGVAMSRPHLRVSVRNRHDSEEIQRRLESWLRERAKIRFSERFERCLEQVRRHGITSEGFKLRRMAKRWGSCSRAGEILLNPELIKAPVDCIDYVILHELCHLKEFEHSPAFYRLQDRVCPDWVRRKHRLERVEL
tara:strand:- start:421 stop:1125 length:705 start_codon:yes stop_codon:yes gene_type:complete